MDLNFRKYISVLVAAACMLLMVQACVYDDDYDVEGSEMEALQFRVLASDTRLTYDGLSTSFDNEDVVGCVIASNNDGSYTFQTNTKWKYEDGVLMLDADAAGHIQKWNDDSDPEKTAEMQNKGYVQLLGDYNYAFFFYYPYVETLDNTYPNSDNNPLAAQLTQDNWTSYPMFVNTDLSGENSELLLEHSDHLWVGYTEGVKGEGDITKDNANYPVNLTFEKKTATIDIHCDVAEGYSITDVSVDSPEDGIIRGVKLDLSSGSTTEYSDYSTAAQNSVYKSNFVPAQIESNEKEVVYRLLLPAQRLSTWNLNVNLNGTPYSIPVEGHLSVLEEGHLYYLHVAKADNGFIVINDWQNGGSSDLIEDQTLPENLTLSSDNGREEVDGAVLVKAGENLIVTGDNLDYASSLRLEGVYKLTEYSSSSDNITFAVPAAAKDGDVYLVTSSGVAVSAGTYVLVKPVAASVDKTSVRPGDVITIKGTDLDLVTGVVFGGGAEASVSINNAEGTELTVTVPDGAASGVISFQLANGTTVACDGLGEISITVPEPTGISAEKFKAGAVVTISGNNLDLITGVVLKWGDTTVEVEEYTTVDASTVKFEMPDEALDGSVYVTATSGEEIFAGAYVLVKPVVTSEAPISVEPRQTLELTGTDLDLVTGVKFYDNIDPSESPSINASSITVKVPGNASTGVLRLSLANGTYVDIQLTVNKVSVASLSTDKGDNDGDNVPEVREGGDITVLGTNLGLVKSVRIDHGGNSVSVEITDSDLADGLTFTLPAEVTAAGTIYLANQYGYEVQASYEMAFPTGVSSLSSPIKAGETVTITGTDMDLVSSVMFQNNVAPVETPVISGTEISVKVPDTAIEGRISLVTKYGKTIDVSYSLVKPVFARYSTTETDPATKAFVGESLIINGSDMDLVTGVTFTGAESVTPTSISADAITVTVPSEAKTGKIYLNLANGTSVECPELTIDYPWCYAENMPKEIYSGTEYLELIVKNSDKITQILLTVNDITNDITTSCTKNDNTLRIPLGEVNSHFSISIISSDHTETYRLDVVQETDLWKGETTLKTWEGVNQDLSDKEADKYRFYVRYTSDSDSFIEIKNQHWQTLVKVFASSGYNVTNSDGGYIDVDGEVLNGQNVLVHGNNMIITKISKLTIN